MKASSKVRSIVVRGPQVLPAEPEDDERALKRKRFYAEWNAGKAERRRGNTPSALRHYAAAIALFDAKSYQHSEKRLADDRASALCNLWSDIAAAHSSQGDASKASTAILRSLKLRRGYNPTPIYNRGVILNQLHRYREAIRCFDQALREVRSLYAYPPCEVGDYFVAKGEALEALGDIDAALANYGHALPLGTGGTQHRAAKAKLRLFRGRPPAKRIGRLGRSPWR